MSGKIIPRVNVTRKIHRGGGSASIAASSPYNAVSNNENPIALGTAVVPQVVSTEAYPEASVSSVQAPADPESTKLVVPKPPRSITFSGSVDSVLNRLGRPLKENNEIYSLSDLRDYRIYQLRKGSKSTLKRGQRAQSHDEVIVTDYNAAENPILKQIYSDKVLKHNDEGKREIARIIEKRKHLKNGIVVKRGSFYFIIQNIDKPRLGGIYKHRLWLLQFPPLTPELELKGVIDETKTSKAFDFEVEIAPIEDLVHLYLNKVFNHINNEMPNAIDKEYMQKIEKAAEEYEHTGSIKKPTNDDSDNSSTTTTSGSREDKSPISPASVAPSIILGALPSDIKIRRISMADYSTLPNKNIPVIIESAPGTIQVMNGLACKVILDNVGKLGSEEDKWLKLLLIKPNEQFKTIRDVLPEQVCFIILFTHMFFTAVVSKPEIQTTQSSSFRQKFKHVQTLLQPLAETHDIEFKKLWDTLQIEYINNAARNISFDQLKAFIISGPQHLMQYFEEATRIHLGETIPRRFFQVAPARRESASVVSGSAPAPTGPSFP